MLCQVRLVHAPGLVSAALGGGHAGVFGQWRARQRYHIICIYVNSFLYCIIDTSIIYSIYNIVFHIKYSLQVSLQDS